MPWIALAALLVLAACANVEGESVAAVAPDPSGWQLTSGKSPSSAEFAALAATCESKGGAVDACLTALGLRRAK